MYINNSDVSRSGNSTAQAETPGAANGTSDVNFFNALMDPTEKPRLAIAPSMSSNLFDMSFADPATLAGRISRGMRDAGLNKKTKEVHALPESLGLANLNVVAAVKAASLLAKGVDKVATMG
jgi:hypothetical protein